MSRLNTLFNYRYQIEGCTPWARVHHLEEFLAGRVRAAALEEVSRLKYEAKVQEYEHLKSIGALPHVLLNLEAEIIETESFFPSQEKAFKQNLEEIEDIKQFLAEVLVIAEPTRIPGYTNDQMFEANEGLEFTVNLARDMQAQIVVSGRPLATQVRNAMSNPFTREALQKIGLLPTVGEQPLQLITEKEIDNGQLLLG